MPKDTVEKHTLTLSEEDLQAIICALRVTVAIYTKRLESPTATQLDKDSTTMSITHMIYLKKNLERIYYKKPDRL